MSCNIPQPGPVDEELNEFWEGSPWEIFRQHNLSAFERNRLFLNAGGRKFVDISYVSGADDDGDARSSIAVDVDHDGRLDLVVRQSGGTPLLVYKNHFSQRHYLKVTLRGTESNRLGIGARLVGSVNGQQIVREVYPVDSYLSQASLVVHFGLNQAERMDELVVNWPSGVDQRIQNLPADRHVVITEGSQDIIFTTPGQLIPP